ncbi:uncharacterized protein LOC101453059 isoform X2 [Ceratitis capitata]|uniref:uncharacterized protein LOC101453059 isoform X2 n=1 Tax=Ceratitis capitata TaxID=7213 RepID=UPI000618845B|nr:uncharacterized protein LOC101453059 isoform X2 [Ceratitis capitata]
MEVRGKCVWQTNKEPRKQQQKQQANQTHTNLQQVFSKQQQQQAQRKCHQKENERTNHLRLQQHEYYKYEREVVNKQQKAHEGAERTQQSLPQKTPLVPEILAIHHHHRWPMPPTLVLTATPLPAHTSPKLSRTSATNRNVIYETVHLTATVRALSTLIAAVTKAKTLVSSYCRKRYSWLWLLLLLSISTQFTSTTTTASVTGTVATVTGVLIAPKLLPHGIYSTATAATTVALLCQATATHAAILSASATTFVPRKAHYEFPATNMEVDEAEDVEGDADADTLVQVQVKRINLLDNDDEADVQAHPSPALEVLEEEEQDVLYDEDQQLTQRAVGRKLNSNEQQLLMFYRRVQHATEQQTLEKQQHEHQHTTAHRHYQRANVEKPAASLLTASKINYADGVPTDADKIPTNVDGDVLATQDLQKHVTKRSATTKLASTTVLPPTSEATASPVKASNVTTGNTTTVTNSTEEEKCEPKVLDEVPPEPFFDFSDIAEDAARQFTEFITNKFGSSGPPTQQAITADIREELQRRANSIASYALNEDENLLAFAIAAPSIQTVVVKFRDDVTIPPDQVHSKAFLGSYWRELSVAWNSTEGTQEWGAPFRDCSVLKGRWLWPFRITFTENKIKIGAAAFIAADEDVCNDGLEEVFGRKHGCDRNTTFCLLTENKPAATRDVYTCICRESFYLPNSTLQGFRGDIVEASDGYGNYSCIPCPDGCTSCDQHGVCLLGEPSEVMSMESLLNVSVGSVLGACILCCVVLSVIVFRQRKCKAIASGMWTVLETILSGIILLYASVAVHFFPATTERCLVEPWLRELGFITCYGAIILKLYRHLVDFRTRKAHRWVLRDIDLLKYLGTMVFAVTCYMAAFTAAALDLIDVSQLGTLREQRTNTCLPLKWEYVTQVSEVLILCFGLHLAFASRNANTQFRERQFLVATLAIEFLMSTTFYVLRFFYLPEMSPSAIFLALFLRSQLTNTMALGLIFVPKLWYQHKQRQHHNNAV